MWDFVQSKDDKKGELIFRCRKTKSSPLVPLLFFLALALASVVCFTCGLSLLWSPLAVLPFGTYYLFFEVVEESLHVSSLYACHFSRRRVGPAARDFLCLPCAGDRLLLEEGFRGFGVSYFLCALHANGRVSVAFPRALPPFQHLNVVLRTQRRMEVEF